MISEICAFDNRIVGIRSLDILPYSIEEDGFEALGYDVAKVGVQECNSDDFLERICPLSWLSVKWRKRSSGKVA